MSRKTFVKVKRGILSPEHVNKIGEAIWLYLYILDRADWETGKIYDWRDQQAADELGIYIGTIRNQRKKLTGKYIDFVGHGRWSELTIRKWADPRSKTGDPDSNPDDIPDNIRDNIPDNQLSNTEGMPDNIPDNMPDNIRDNMLDSTLSPLHIIKNTDIRSQIIYKDTQISPMQKLIESITGIMPNNQADIDAISEIEALNPTEQDILAGFEWLKNQGVKLRHYSSLVNPISVCMSKRTQKPMTTLEKSKAAIMQAMAEMETEGADNDIFK